MIPYGHQSIDEDDINAVIEVLRGDWLTQGPTVDTFEQALADKVGARYAVTFTSGTAALHAAMSAGGIGRGDLVVTSPLSFVASANCARYVGATVAFADIDPSTLNLDLQAMPVDADAVVAVHYAGLPLDLEQLPVRPRVLIEDAAHALGAETTIGPVGNCAFSDMCVFSFHPVKSITTGEGGAVTTNDAVLAERLRRFRNHGIVRRPQLGGWYYEIDTLGFNYRLTDLQAALGLSQLRRLDDFITQRNEVAGVYRASLADANVLLPPEAPVGWRHSYHLFAVRVPNRDRVFDQLRKADVGVQVHYIPIYRHALYRSSGTDQVFKNTEDAYGALLSLPIFPGLAAEDQAHVIRALLAAL